MSERTLSAERKNVLHFILDQLITRYEAGEELWFADDVALTDGTNNATVRIRFKEIESETTP